MLKLLDAQTTLLQRPASAENQKLMEQLRRDVPAPVLAHFLRLVGQGRRGVAAVRHGVCSQCHIRVPSGMTAVLAKSDDVHLCEQCGSFLVLPDDEMPNANPKPVPTATRARKQSRALAA